jgi:hypothetical protein
MGTRMLGYPIHEKMYRKKVIFLIFSRIKDDQVLYSCKKDSSWDDFPYFLGLWPSEAIGQATRAAGCPGEAIGEI